MGSDRLEVGDGAWSGSVVKQLNNTSVWVSGLRGHLRRRGHAASKVDSLEPRRYIMRSVWTPLGRERGLHGYRRGRHACKERERSWSESTSSS